MILLTSSQGIPLRTIPFQLVMTEAKLLRLNSCHLQMTLSCWEDSYVLQRFLVVISKWRAENKMQLNLSKCIMMFFHHGEACFLVN